MTTMAVPVQTLPHCTTPDHLGTAMRQLAVGHLQLDLLAAQNRIVFAPVELEGLTELKDQRHECPASVSLLAILGLPQLIPGKRRQARMRATIAQGDEFSVMLPGGPLLLA